MAVAWDDIPASELTDRAADLPMMGSQLIPVSPDYVKWVDSGQIGANNITTWTDRTDSDYPIRRAYDGKNHLATKTDGFASGNWRLCIDLGETVAIDYFAVIGHNFDTLSLTHAELEVVDTNDWQTNLRTVGAMSLRGSDKRLIDADLDHAANSEEQRYTGVQFLSLHLQKGSDFTPEVGELFVGRTYQFGHMPAVPWDDVGFVEDVVWSETAQSGVIDQAVHYRRAFELNALLREHETTHIGDIKDWYRKTRGPFVWCYQPNSALAAWHFMMRRGGLSFPAQGFIEREVSIEAREQGPESLFLDVEDNG